MKRILPFAFLLAIVSCKSKQEELKEKLMPIIKTTALQDSLVVKIDSLNILDIRNLNDSIYAERTLINKLNQFDYYVTMLKYSNEELQLLIDNIKNKQRQVALYSDLDGFSTLRNIAVDELKDEMDEFKGKMKTGELYKDSINILQKETDDISDRLKKKKYNTKNSRGYFVLFNILGSDKRNLEVRKDSMNIYVSPSFRLIPINKM